MSGRAIDLNADVAESFGRWQLGDDQSLLPLLTSANVACGFHAGDPRTIRTTVARAVDLGVRVGAQVSYRDLAGFGRRVMHVEPDDLIDDVLFQLSSVDGLARLSGDRVRYLKPHGALYHRVLTDGDQAEAVALAVSTWQRSIGPMTVLTSTGELADRARAHGVDVVLEGFTDRRYRADGHLVPRSEADALLTDTGTCAAQALTLADDASIGSLCVHGDTPGATAIAGAVRHALRSHGHRVHAFT
jgi:5-oxoprolinase (ATP-hydrolysing) subunit A